MMPQPLHPAVVHFPIVFSVLLPVMAAVAIVLIRRGTRPSRVWLPVVAVSVVLTGSTWIAIQTGKNEEERVEQVVSESAIETHEEAAEVFLPLSAGLLLLVGAGLLDNRSGGVFRYVALGGALLLLAQGFRVGHSGGELVYRHGAASAYASGTSTTAPARTVDGEREGGEEGHQRR
ncbi:MAG: DUF2231 domain-containing protein [Longimicrobiales bacterium]